MYQKYIFSCEIVLFSLAWVDVNTSWNSSFFRWLTAILYLLWLSFCLITSKSFALRDRWSSRVLRSNEGYNQDPHRHHHRSLIAHGDSSSSIFQCRNGSFLACLTNYINFLWRSTIFVLLSSAGFFYHRTMGQASCTREDPIAGRLTYYKRWQKNKSADNSCRTKQPLSRDHRSEDCLRLPFVDDQCLRTAMQGFLTRESSRMAR